MLHSHAELGLRFAAGNTVVVQPTDPLPAGPFALTRITIPAARTYPADFVSAVLLPAVRDLQGLDAITDGAPKLTYSADELTRLAACPAAANLTRLDGRFELTSATLEAVKRFPKLTTLTCLGSAADDEILGRLTELPGLKGLNLYSFGSDGKVGDKGRAALTALSLTSLGLTNSTVDPAFARRIAAMPTLTYVMLYGKSGTDDNLAEIARSATLTRVTLFAAPVTDAGLQHLHAMRPLRSLNLKRDDRDSRRREEAGRRTTGVPDRVGRRRN